MQTLRNTVHKSAKTFVFLSVPTYGHINPTLPIVQTLTKRGHRVIYFSTTEFKQSIQKHGAVFKPYWVLQLPDIHIARNVVLVSKMFWNLPKKKLMSSQSKLRKNILTALYMTALHSGEKSLQHV